MQFGKLILLASVVASSYTSLYASARDQGVINVPDSSHLAVPVRSKKIPSASLKVLDASQAAQVVELVNQERTSRGLVPLTINAALTSAAEGHSQAMAERDFYSHCDPDTGTDPGERIAAAGYEGEWAENIAAGFSGPSEVMDAWMNNEGHRNNILNANYREIGVGIYVQNDDEAGVRLDNEPEGNPDCVPDGNSSHPYQRYWTQVFGKSSTASQGAQLSLGALTPSRAEGDSGTTSYTFRVTRSGDLSGSTSVDWAVSGNGSHPANAADFSGGVLPEGSVSFSANETIQEFTVAVAGDTEVEADEGFAVTLSNASNGSIASGTATAMIQNDDAAAAPAGFTVTPKSGLTVDEAGSLDSFSVVLDSEPANPVSFDIVSADTGEVQVLTSTLNFSSVDWQSPKTVTVAGVDDAEVDGSQTVTITVSVSAGSDAAYAALADQTVTVTNADDDVATPVSVPSVPLALEVTPGEGSLEVSWVAPADDGGSPIVSYLAEANTTCQVAALANEVPGNTSYSCIFENLNPERTYEVTVVAVNEAGRSAAAVASASPLGVSPPEPDWRFSERSDGVYANLETMQNEGLSVAYFDNQGTPFAFFAWYTYDEAGFQRYIVAAGPISTTELDDGTRAEVVTAEAVITEGGTFGPSASPTPAEETVFGTLSFVPMTCNGLAVYDEDGELIELLERVGSFRSCEEASQGTAAYGKADQSAEGAPLPSPLNVPPESERRFSERSDGVYANLETMQNEGVSVAYFDNQGIPFAFFAWYTYDEAGFQRYVVAAGPISTMQLDDGTTAEVVTAEAVITEGGTFGPSASPTPAEEIAFGTYSFVPMTCNGLELYDEDGELIELLDRVGSFRSCN